MIFIKKLSRIAHAKRHHHKNFAEKTFANSYKTAKFTKVSPSKVLCYTTVIQTQQNITVSFSFRIVHSCHTQQL